MDQQCIRALVSGRVQGVSFRASAREQARRLGITGHARNLPDGQVEVLACGDEEALEELVQWLHKGPPTADVRHVEVTVEEHPVPESFAIR